jgi:hypothetical protein
MERFYSYPFDAPEPCADVTDQELEWTLNWLLMQREDFGRFPGRSGPCDLRRTALKNRCARILERTSK